jgi:phosphoadenosine phosphosulfate reductase
MSSVTIPHTLETSHPAEVVRWAAEQYGVDGLVVTASFEDAVLVHVAATAVPGIEIVLLDTQYLFAETEWFAEQLRQRLDLNLRVVRPLADVQPDNLWQTDTAACCNVRKVEPLQRAIAGRRAWLTGVRRVDGPTRATTPVAAYDVGRGLVKVNPLATFTDDDMALYEQLYELPRNPLTDRGYPSIGCWPCTRPVAPGEDKRAGRWAGSEKTECGLHT